MPADPGLRGKQRVGDFSQIEVAAGGFPNNFKLLEIHTLSPFWHGFRHGREQASIQQIIKNRLLCGLVIRSVIAMLWFLAHQHQLAIGNRWLIQQRQQYGFDRLRRR